MGIAMTTPMCVYFCRPIVSSFLLHCYVCRYCIAVWVGWLLVIVDNSIFTPPRVPSSAVFFFFFLLSQFMSALQEQLPTNNVYVANANDKLPTQFLREFTLQFCSICLFLLLFQFCFRVLWLNIYFTVNVNASLCMCVCVCV